MSIAVEHRDRGRVDVTIDRPEVRNALDLEHQRFLDHALTTLEQDARVRVIVLTGAGDRAFCAGADLRDDDGADDYLARRLPTGFGGVSLRASCPVPLVARINGHAVGGGLEMVLGCHVAVMADHATLGLPEPLVGRAPLDGGVELLSRALPRARALELLLTGRRISANEALEFGLVNRVVTADELDGTVDALVDELLGAAPLAQRAILALVRNGNGADVTAYEAVQRMLRSADGREGAVAFKEKRRPVWQGR